MMDVPRFTNHLGLQPIFPLECLPGLRENLLRKFTIAKDRLIPLLECTAFSKDFKANHPPTPRTSPSPVRSCLLPAAISRPLIARQCSQSLNEFLHGAVRKIAQLVIVQIRKGVCRPLFNDS